MATSHTPLLADRHRDTDGDSAFEEPDRDTRPILYGFATTSPTHPFSTTLPPTLLLRTLALLLSLPAFFLLLPFSTPTTKPLIVFLSFSLFRQLWILLTYFGSKIIVIKFEIEVVHERFKAAQDWKRHQELWIKRALSAGVDVVVLVGLLVSLSVVAREVDYWEGGRGRDELEGAVVLGFLSFGLLLISIPDFGNPGSVSLALSVEKPGNGRLILGSSLVYGLDAEEEEDGVGDNGYGSRARRWTGKGNVREDDEV